MNYNLFWICDSGVRVLPLALRDLVSKMTDKVALVHAVPYTSNRKGFSSIVEKVSLVWPWIQFQTDITFVFIFTRTAVYQTIIFVLDLFRHAAHSDIHRCLRIRRHVHDRYVYVNTKRLFRQVHGRISQAVFLHGRRLLHGQALIREVNTRHR